MQFMPAGPAPFRALLDACPDAVLALDGGGVVVYANPASGRLLGCAPGHLAGRPLAHVVPELLRDPRIAALLGHAPESAPDSSPRPREIALRTGTGAAVLVEVHLAELAPGGEHRVAVYLRDVTRRSAAERRLRTGNAVDRVLAESRSWEEAAPRILQVLCEGLEWEVGLLWQAEADAPVLCFAGAWSTPGAHAGPLLEMSRRMVFLPRVGVPGRVWESRSPVWIADLSREPGFLRAPAALAGDGLRSVFAFPILLGDETFGVLEFFTRQRPEPDVETREMLAAVGSGIGQFVLRRRNEAALRAREQRFRALIEYATDVVTVLDARGRVRYQSPAVERVLGYAPEKLLGSDVFALLHPEDVARARRLFALALRRPGVPVALEIRTRHRDGTWHVMESVGRSLLDAPEVGGVVVNSRDVTSRRRVEEEVRRLSLTDELTGVYNRRGFFALAEQQLRAAQRSGTELALLFADLDGLKLLNDRFGHTAGDRALVETATLLRQVFRGSDVVARVGGDEFVILAPGASRAQGEAMLERLRARVRERNAARPGEPELSLSTGLAWYDPVRLCTVEALLAEADQAMYALKRRR